MMMIMILILSVRLRYCIGLLVGVRCALSVRNITQQITCEFSRALIGTNSDGLTNHPAGPPQASIMSHLFNCQQRCQRYPTPTVLH